jgi:hypothetical protein
MEYIKLLSGLLAIQISFVALGIILTILMYENKDKDK